MSEGVDLALFLLTCGVRSRRSRDNCTPPSAEATVRAAAWKEGFIVGIGRVLFFFPWCAAVPLSFGCQFAPLIFSNTNKFSLHDQRRGHSTGCQFVPPESACVFGIFQLYFAGHQGSDKVWRPSRDSAERLFQNRLLCC